MRSARSEKKAIAKRLEAWVMLALAIAGISYFLYREFAHAAFDYDSLASPDAGGAPVLEPAPPRYTPPPIEQD